jgi:hypothetical protein
MFIIIIIIFINKINKYVYCLPSGIFSIFKQQIPLT